MANSTVNTPGLPNVNLYNGGSEWQNVFGNLPDYYQTFYRNLDPAIGRFICPDPEGESSESMSCYQYANNNPVVFNDPMGDYPEAKRFMPQPGIPDFDVSGKLTAQWEAQVAAQNANLDLLWAAQHGDLDALNEYTKNNGGITVNNTPDRNALIAGYLNGDTGIQSFYKNGVFVIGWQTGDVNQAGVTYHSVHLHLNDEVANQGAENKEGFDWFDFGNKTNASLGAVVTATDVARIGGLIRVGDKIVMGVGVGGGVAGTALDGYGLYNYYHPNANNVNSRVSPTKFGVDGTMTAFGIWGGPPGEIGAATYFGIDAFYPGGVKGYATDYGEITENMPDLQGGW